RGGWSGRGEIARQQVQLPGLLLDRHARDQRIDGCLARCRIGSGRPRGSRQQERADRKRAPERSTSPATEHDLSVPYPPRVIRARAWAAAVETLCPAMAVGGLAGGLGFEPRLAESESAVLPLDDPPPRAAIGPDRAEGMKRESSVRRRALQPIWPGVAPPCLAKWERVCRMCITKRQFGHRG